ncbi:unnamed protein product [Bursaphelenchus okinawaensis]|uniref:Hexosyltransferase n=1 Tax=Bursaphelenchus okinawaensis TaxID=465554 RepID=A0A811JV44_9BILA|nr:unnamed protein product [Bursaphelenchus okinawaensis]CAG9084492.1 unnamed protein product [Bursaphelenchus okinawaensis]
MRLFSRPLVLCGFGLVLGFLGTVLLFSFKDVSKLVIQHSARLSPRPRTSLPQGRNTILVGIMTAAKYVDTRAYNVWRTWAKYIPGKVLFFVAEDTVSAYPEMPLVRLKGVDDTYPPQKKSFAMLRWMYDNHIDNFDWFLRADDDLYVRGDLLEDFLGSLDPSKTHFIGQAGLGNSAEYGQLSLGPSENYCMGGPGVILSKETLRTVAPYLESCLSELLTTHEDVEVGRCIRKHAGVACTWNYEMQTLFHNNQTIPNAYSSGVSDEVSRAITLHPVKDPQVMKKLHVAVNTMKLKQLRAQRIELLRLIKKIAPASLNRRVSNKTNDLQVWDFLHFNKLTFCANQVNCPRHTIDMNVHSATQDIVTQLFDEFNVNARQRGRLLQFQNIQYGYTRVEPRHGVDYVLDMILWFKKFRPPHRATLSVRRHAYIQQVFGEPEAISEAGKRALLRSGEKNNTDSAGKNGIFNQVLYFIIPLKGRAATFLRFIENLKQIIELNDHRHQLVIILYNSGDQNEDAMIRSILTEITSKMMIKIIDMGDKEFSRGQALTAGSAILPDDALMFFTDVDMILSYDTIQRIRLNTIQNYQVYFPIVFSEFSPKFWNPTERNDHHQISYARQRGYFRHFGYGLVSIYRSDFVRVGGFNLTIRGWGMEDVDLFEKVIASPTLRVFRAPDPGLVHVFHDIHCPPDIPAAQHHMCLGSQAASMASLDSLAEHFANYA